MTPHPTRLCFVVEDRYRNDGMPLAVARRLAAWGHQIELLEPQRSVTAISEVIADGARFDAYVLKTVSDGPGLSILDAAAAAGHVTINCARSVRLARDKAVAAAVGRSHGLPVPLTYFAAERDLVRLVPHELYPIVVKPANGSSCEGVHLVRTPEQLAVLDEMADDDRFLLVQPYAANPGVDVKLYCIDEEIFATRQPSPLHPDVNVRPELIELTSDLDALAREVGRVFGLSLYGVDVVESPQGWMVVDVNDFPSFKHVPDAVSRVASAILRLAGRDERASQLANEVGAAAFANLESSVG